MPQINGTCVPPVCLRRKLLAANAKVILTITVNGVVKETRDVTKLMNALLAQGLKDLTAIEDLKCDGCVCYTVATFKPPRQVPAVTVVQEDTETAPNGDTVLRKYEVNASFLLMSMGLCYPPGTQIEVDGKKYPVETAPPPKAPAGGGKAGGKEGGGKKKRHRKKPKRVAKKKKPGKRRG